LSVVEISIEGAESLWQWRKLDQSGRTVNCTQWLGAAYVGRVSVGRSTFYLHYRDKDNPLLSQFEKFLETMSTALSIRKEESH